MKKIIAYILIATLPVIASATTVNFTNSSTWTAPTGVTSVEAQVWGDGGGGGCGQSSSGGGGGGGGAYSETDSITVVPGNVYVVTVGQGGVGASGGFCAGVSPASGIGSMFYSSTTVYAQGGGAGTNSGAAGVGGSSTSGYGMIKYTGGTGGYDSTAHGYGGGGGGGAGTTNNGNNGNNSTISSDGTGGTGASVGGGTGGNAGVTGSNGNTYGGGGGSSEAGYGVAGSGARGEVDLTYTAGSTQSPMKMVGIIGGKLIINY